MRTEKIPPYTRKEYEIPDFMEDGNAASVTECTGLIQIPALTHDEWEEYDTIMKFSPPEWWS